MRERERERERGREREGEVEEREREREREVRERESERGKERERGEREKVLLTCSRERFSVSWWSGLQWLPLRPVHPPLAPDPRQSTTPH